MESRFQDFVSPQQVKVLDAIEELQSCGINKTIPLLQIIICGEEFSSKSSLLAALSGIPFASRSTRFPVEIVLQRAPRALADVRIIPHSSRSVEEQKKLASFSPSNIALDDACYVQNLLEKATKAMSLPTSEDAPAKDVLRICINGPQCPFLKLVDFPEFSSSDLAASSSNEAIIQNMAHGYVKDHPSIILEVISKGREDMLQNGVNNGQAKIDFELNTSGVIKKPEKFCAAPSRKSRYFKMTKDELEKSFLDWHIVYTDSSTAGKSGSQNQNEDSEAKYFHRSTLACLTPSRFDKGLSRLISGIQAISSQQMKLTLRPMINELAEELVICEKKLTELGPERQTDEQQV